MALIEGASVVCILLHSAKIDVAFRREPFIIENALFISVCQSLCFNFLLESYQGSEQGSDRRGEPLQCDSLLAAGA